jgi:hypothetical protein
MLAAMLANARHLAPDDAKETFGRVHMGIATSVLFRATIHDLFSGAAAPLRIPAVPPRKQRRCADQMNTPAMPPAG